jgi:hypothetical protein
MTATKVTKLFCGITAATLCMTGLALGETSVMEVKQQQLDGLPQNLWKRIQEHQKAVESLDDSEAAKGVYSTIWLWPPTYPKLRVCFFGGPQLARQLIAKTAKEWESSEMGIKLDFGDMNDPRLCGQGDGRENQIRVSFDKPGYWSQLGQFSVVYTKQEEASMNFEGLDKIESGQTYNNYAFGTIRHEFGHALGLYHEHQSPESHCDQEFNWNYVYEYLKGPPNNWPQEQIDFNLRPLDPTQVPGVMVTDFDNTSVMLYQFPDKYYVKGAASRCYIPAPNDQISRVDRAVVNYMYPANPQSRMERFQNNKGAFAAIWNKASDEGRKGVMVDMMKTFFESPGTANQ